MSEDIIENNKTRYCDNEYLNEICAKIKSIQEIYDLHTCSTYYNEIPKEDHDKMERFLKMSEEEYDKYMCTTYSFAFGHRGKPMSQTCMCWGFCIGKGWYYLLDRLCYKLSIMQKHTGYGVIFDQIKEKYGTARFYYHIAPYPGHKTISIKKYGRIGLILTNTWNYCSEKIYTFFKKIRDKIRFKNQLTCDTFVDLMDDMVSKYEDKTNHTCAVTGLYTYYGKFSIGCWVHDECIEAYIMENEKDSIKTKDDILNTVSRYKETHKNEE